MYACDQYSDNNLSKFEGFMHLFSSYKNTSRLRFQRFAVLIFNIFLYVLRGPNMAEVFHRKFEDFGIN